MSRNIRRTQSRKSGSPDRLTQVLVGVAALLALLAAGVEASLLIDRRTDRASTVGREQPRTPVASPLPAASPTASPIPVTPPPCVRPYDWTVHVVREGDTLYSLARRYGTDVESLQRVNCLDTDIIWLDSELYVPGPPGASVPPTVPVVALTAEPIALAERYLNIILLGSDKRQGSSTWRTDTIIVVSVDTERSIVRVLSIPRDLWVDIPGHGYDRINTADLWGELAHGGGGPDLVKQTVEKNLGLPIDYYVRVDFDGFQRIIDAVGGVDVDVECALPDIELEPGMHHMDGEEALLYARSRITTSDFDRSRRQRKILMALWAKGRSMNIIPRLPALWMAMRGTFETDLPLGIVLSLAKAGLELSPNRIFSQSIGPWQVENWTTPLGAQVLLPIPDKIQELLNGFYGPIDFEFLQKVNATAVEVLNGSTLAQGEQLAATALGWAGFQIPRTGMADRQDYATSQIIVYNAEPKVAELVAQQLDLLPESLVYLPDPSSTVDIRVILGGDYDPCQAR